MLKSINFIKNKILSKNISAIKKLPVNLPLTKNFTTTQENIENDNDFKIKSEGLNKHGTKTEKKVGMLEKNRMKFKSKEERENRIKLLKREITDNPEFFNAFPHLREVAAREEMDNEEDDVTEFTKKNYLVKDEDKNQDILEKKSNYFESLLNKHKGYEDLLKTEEQKLTNNKTIFIEGSQHPKGPMKFMSREEKNKIHSEIDRRMQELEDSGLSREEILHNKGEGIPLRDDKFFQYIKRNKIAREMLIKPTETFNVDIVLERALKQDIGPDGSVAGKSKSLKLGEDMPLDWEIKKHKEMYNPKRKDSLLTLHEYDYKTNYLEKLKAQMNIERSKPVSFVNPPKTRQQLRKRFMIKTITKDDVTWKNLPLLCKFLNEGGKLLNRYQTRLPTHVHMKLAKTVKHARNMGLLPFVDFIKPYHKVPFTSLYNEFLEDTSKVIDKNTGMIKLVHLPSDKDKYTYSSYDNAVEANDESLKA